MDSDDDLYLGAQLKRWRKARPLTLDQMAADLDTSKGHLSDMERNKRPLSTRWLERVAAFYEVRVSDIIGASSAPADPDDEWASWEKKLREAGQLEMARAILQTLVSGGTIAAPPPAEQEKASSKARKAR